MIITVTVTVYRLHSTFGDLFEDAGRQAVQVPGHTVVVVSDVEVPAVTFIPKSAWPDCELYFYKSDGALTSEFFFKLHVANHILKCFEMYPNQICHRQPYCQILNVFNLSKSSNLSSPTIFWSQHSSSPACKQLLNNKFSKSFQMFQMYKFNKKSMFFANVFPDMSKYFQLFPRVSKRF